MITDERIEELRVQGTRDNGRYLKMTLRQLETEVRREEIKASGETLSEFLFKGIEGCLDGNCIIRKPKGMHTNGGCRCMTNFTRSQLTLLGSRLRAANDMYRSL